MACCVSRGVLPGWLDPIFVYIAAVPLKQTPVNPRVDVPKIFHHARNQLVESPSGFKRAWKFCLCPWNRETENDLNSEF